MIRALVVGTAEFVARETTREWDSGSLVGFSPLPSVLPAVRSLARSLARFADVELVGGSPVENPDLNTLNEHWRALRTSGAEAAIVFFTGHGVARGTSLYLPVPETDPARLPDTAISVVRWLEEVENTDNAVPTLFVFDVCESGTAALHQGIQAIFSRDRKAWVIASCAPDEKAFGARFTTAFAVVLDQLRAGRLNGWPRSSHVPLSVMARKVSEEMERHLGENILPQTVFRTPEYVAEQQHPFFSDPNFTEDGRARMFQGMDAGLREMTDAVLARAPGLDPVHFFTRVTGTPPGKPYTGACFFTGRVAELRSIAEWMRDGPSLLTVTGSPGTGKSALLGVVTCLCHPQMRDLSAVVRSRVPREVRPTTGSAAFAAVHARFRDPIEVLELLAAQLGLEPDKDGWTAERFAERLAGLDEPAVLVIDAIDESLDSRGLVDDVILPLLAARSDSDQPVCWLAVGVRPWWDQLPGLRFAASRGRLIDLDTSTSAPLLAEELATYLDDLLGGTPGFDVATAEAIGTRLAKAEGRFLLASLFADHLARNPTLTSAEAVGLLPVDLPGMFRLQLDSTSNPLLPAILAVVAQAKGQGMPLDLIQRCLPAQEPAATLDEVRAALGEAGFYLRMDNDLEDGLLFRFYHQSLVDHFLAEMDGQSLLAGLLAAVPAVGELRAWGEAHAYLRRHVLDHALDTGGPSVDALILDAGLLVHAEPRSVIRTLNAAVSTYGQRQALIYASSYSTTIRLPPAQRKQVLALDAVRQGRRDLAQAFWNVRTDGENPPLRFVWATGPGRVPNLLITIGPATVEHASALAVGHSNDTPVVLIGGSCGVVDVHDTVHGTVLFSLDGHGEPIVAIETVDLDDITLAVTGSASKVCAWNLADGSRYSEHVDAGLGLTALQIERNDEDGVLMAYLATDSGELRYVDLDTGEKLHTQSGLGPDVRAMRLRVEEGELHVQFTYASAFTEEAAVTAVGLGVLNGNNVEIVGDQRGCVRVWESDGQERLLHELSGYDRGYVMKFDRWPSEHGRDETVRVISEEKGAISAVALGHLRGLPVAVTFQEEDGVRIWDIGYRSIINPAGVGTEEALRLTRLGERAVVAVEIGAYDRPKLDPKSHSFEMVRIEPYSMLWARVDGEQIGAIEAHMTELVANTTSVTTPVRLKGDDTSDDGLDWTAPVVMSNGKSIQVASEQSGLIRVRDAASGEYIGGPLFLPSAYPRPTQLAADVEGLAVYWAHEIAALEWEWDVVAEKSIPSPEVTHVVAWFPGVLFANAPELEAWDIHSMADWADGRPDPSYSIGAPIDVEPEVLKRLVTRFLDGHNLDFLSLERSEYGVSLIEENATEHEFPIFFVTTIEKPEVV
ncbi:hypothetical protein ACWGE0_31670 [Lentzea sp. NPDC054927]